MTTTKIGRPRKYENESVSWGMRVTKEERKKIQELGKIYKKPASQIMMELVDKALNEVKVSTMTTLTKRFTAKELRAMPREERANILKEQAKIAMLDLSLMSP